MPEVAGVKTAEKQKSKLSNARVRYISNSWELKSIWIPWEI